MRKKQIRPAAQVTKVQKEIQTHLGLGKTNVYMGAKEPPHPFDSFSYCPV